MIRKEIHMGRINNHNITGAVNIRNRTTLTYTKTVEVNIEQLHRRRIAVVGCDYVQSSKSMMVVLMH